MMNKLNENKKSEGKQIIILRIHTVNRIDSL